MRLASEQKVSTVRALHKKFPRRGTEFLNYEAHLHGAFGAVRAAQFLNSFLSGLRAHTIRAADSWSRRHCANIASLTTVADGDFPNPPPPCLRAKSVTAAPQILDFTGRGTSKKALD